MLACSNFRRICARIVLVVGSTRDGENSLRSGLAWEGIFYLFMTYLGMRNLLRSNRNGLAEE